MFELLKLKDKAQQDFHASTEELVCIMDVKFYVDLKQSLNPYDLMRIFDVTSGNPKTVLGCKVVLAYAGQVDKAMFCLMKPRSV